MSRLRFIQVLSETDIEQLTQAYKSNPDFSCRQRAHAILLSHKGYTILQLKNIFDVDRDTIVHWFDRFEQSGLDGLYNAPVSGRPPIYIQDEIQQLKELIDQEPRQIKQAQAVLQSATGKTSCTTILKRALKKLNYSWHRCRRSLKSKRDPEAFKKEQQNQEALKQLANLEMINLYYFDESGFSTIPSVPYAWQPVGTTRELPSFYSKRLNLLGFMSHKGKTVIYPTEEKVNTEQVVLAFDRFTLDYENAYRDNPKPCVVNLDNASFHTSQALQEHINKWGSRGVILHYLPPYSPELNLIEILWRKIKYEWLPLTCYSSYKNMKNAVLDILDKLGTEYKITFV